jgi:hypothetical protein
LIGVFDIVQAVNYTIFSNTINPTLLEDSVFSEEKYRQILKKLENIMANWLKFGFICQL